MILHSGQFCHCEIIANLLQLAYYKGIDCYSFAKILMTSEYGSCIMKDGRMTEYADEGFMLEGFEREFELTYLPSYEGDTDYSMWFAGFVYKYWCYLEEETPEEIYELAPLELLAQRHAFYHTQDYDYIIDDIRRRPWNSPDVLHLY